MDYYYYVIQHSVNVVSTLRDPTNVHARKDTVNLEDTASMLTNVPSTCVLSTRNVSTQSDHFYAAVTEDSPNSTVCSNC